MYAALSISVIIPVLNEEKVIGAQVQRLLAAGGPSVREVLVIDGGSRDATIARAEAAGARVVSASVASRAAQMNLGAATARGPILYFVHADTTPPPSFAQDIAESLRDGYRMGCYRYRFDSSRLLLRFNAYFNRFPFLWCQGGDKTFFIEKAFFQEMGGYCEQHVIMEEYDFLARAQRRTPLRIVPKYAVVSARKYQRNSWLRVQLANMLVFNLWRWGVPPPKLKRLYGRLLGP